MSRMRRLVVAIVVLGAVACDARPAAKPAPTGPIADVAKNIAAILAPATDVTDPRFEQFLTDLDLAGAYGSRAGEIERGIRTGRAKVTAPRSAAAPIGARLASLRGVLGESLVLEYAKTLGDALDEFTKHSGTHEFPPLPPTSHTSDDATTATTSSTTRRDTISSTGSRVDLTIVWSYRETTKDKGTGATLVDIAEDRTMSGGITVCPDTQGAVNAFLDVKGTFTASVGGRSTTLSVTTSSVFTGYVSDAASLTTIHHTLQDKQQWQTASDSGEYDMTMSVGTAANGDGSFGEYDQGSVEGSYRASSDAAVERMKRSAAWSLVLDGHSLDAAYRSAQRLFRNGRCVMVEAPDYRAETPLEVGDQQKSQHDEEVDVSSETKLQVKLKHRFEGSAPSAPVNAALTSGAKKVEPGRIDGGSGQLTYTAPDEEGKQATLQLQSTSKRGIGTLVLDFHTGSNALTLTITGELSSNGNAAGFGVVRILDRVTIGPVEFAKQGTLWVGQGKWSSELSSYTAVGGGTNTCTGSEGGTVEMMATLETRGADTVWVVNPLDASAEGEGTETCTNSLGGITLRGVTLPATVTQDSTGDSGGIFIGLLQPFTLPKDGGRTSVSGSAGGDRGTFTAQGTAVGTTKKN